VILYLWLRMNSSLFDNIYVMIPDAEHFEHYAEMYRAVNMPNVHLFARHDEHRQREGTRTATVMFCVNEWIRFEMGFTAVKLTAWATEGHLLVISAPRSGHITNKSLVEWLESHDGYTLTLAADDHSLAGIRLYTEDIAGSSWGYEYAYYYAMGGLNEDPIEYEEIPSYLVDPVTMVAEQ